MVVVQALWGDSGGRCGKSQAAASHGLPGYFRLVVVSSLQMAGVGWSRSRPRSGHAPLLRPRPNNAEEPMSSSVELYGTAYGNFATQALEQVRRETYGEDLGQSSWVTGQEYRRCFEPLGPGAPAHGPCVCCASAGPAP